MDGFVCVLDEDSQFAFPGGSLSKPELSNTFFRVSFFFAFFFFFVVAKPELASLALVDFCLNRLCATSSVTAR